MLNEHEHEPERQPDANTDGHIAQLITDAHRLFNKSHGYTHPYTDRQLAEFNVFVSDTIGFDIERDYERFFFTSRSDLGRVLVDRRTGRRAHG